jgi:hypothetical protein
MSKNSRLQGAPAEMKPLQERLAGAISIHDNLTMNRTLLIAITCVLLFGCTNSTVEETTNPASGLSSWKTVDQAFSLELVQLLPDFVRAVFEAKGMPGNVIEAVSGYCVFGTIIRNRADTPLSYDMRDWRYVTADGVEHRAKPKSDWVREWRDQGIAFRWSLLYEAQTYAVGDWGQGFTTVNLPPGTHFDLHYNWQQAGKSHERIIRNMHCAPAVLAN